MKIRILVLWIKERQMALMIYLPRCFKCAKEPSTLLHTLFINSTCQGGLAYQWKMINKVSLLKKETYRPHSNTDRTAYVVLKLER